MLFNSIERKGIKLRRGRLSIKKKQLINSNFVYNIYKEVKKKLRKLEECDV